MAENKQKQTAGDNSTQIQAGIIQYITNVSGIDEDRAREICREEYALTKQDWTSEAISIADSRVRIFEDKLLPRMVQYDKSLKFFADPSFQFTLRKAQIAAASSERVEDYDLLAELLVNRVDQDKNRERRLGIVKAIEVVDQVDENALIGLSMVYAISKFVPKPCLLSKGLSILDLFYGKILSGKQLPMGETWMEHLDLLSAIRIRERELHQFKKLEEYIPGRLRLYFEKGIKEDSSEYKSLKDKIDHVSLNPSCFVPHPLKPGYLFLNTPRDINQIKIIKCVGQIKTYTPPNEEQREVLQEALSLACEDGTGDQEMLGYFWKEWDKYENLDAVHKWWNSLSGSFGFTPVGVALSNAYIHGKDSSVPCMY